MIDWRGMAEAPCDGSDILAYCRDFNCMKIVFWKDGHFFMRENPAIRILAPMGWVPLPVPKPEWVAINKQEI